MIRSLTLSLLAAGALHVPAFAEQDPNPGAHDPRVRYVAYDPMNVVRVQAADLRSTMLQFGNDETIDVVAIGDQTAWAWAKVRNLLFLRPSISPARRTNAQVVTLRKDGTQRIYQLDLVPGDAGTPVFGINFAYPADMAEARRKAAAERTAQIASDQAKGRLQTSYFMGSRNWAYVARGSSSIQPSEVSDNGETTVFRFPGNSPQPAIYTVTADGKEQIASITNDDDLVIAHTTSRGWRMRMGDEVCEIWNVAYDQASQNPRTGTTSPEVIRTVHAPARGTQR